MKIPDRLDLQDYLKGLCPNVYFQPPENLELKYPCIIYSVSSTSMGTYANNNPYIVTNAYDITCVSSNPDWDVPTKLANGVYSATLEQSYLSGNMHHWMLSIK